MIRILPHSGKVAMILVLGVFAGAAAQVDCGIAPGAPGAGVPVPLAQAGHPIPPSGLAAPTVAGPAACGPTASSSSGSSVPATGAQAPGSSGQPLSLEGISTDVLHGLPASDLLGPPAAPPERRDFE